MLPRLWIIPVGLLLAAAVLWWPLSSARAARNAAVLAAIRLDDALRAERELDRLRAALPGAIGSGAPTGDAAVLVQQAVRDAGLPAQVVAEVSPQEAAVVSSGAATAGAANWKRRSVQVRLNPLPLPDVGAFLHHLRGAAGEWTVSQTDLQAEPARNGGAGAGADPVLYRLALRLTCTYLERPPDPLPPPASTPRATP
ncbi:MAG: hypothetical protein AB7V47_15625 [Phycisphaerales bacterium]